MKKVWDIKEALYYISIFGGRGESDFSFFFNSEDFDKISGTIKKKKKNRIVFAIIVQDPGHFECVLFLAK